ncbi:hypothetical protein AVEN_106314-1 [Araneus ventricosus]|uniref:Uncharacterized protein n=1 Tax=Araneus ventricosus TaxID=182803 RepID=A0A4Y2AS22_ARAVE|nr:hypothetical protein AVEN_106314-1 [Araneus ventricosus]
MDENKLKQPWPDAWVLTSESRVYWLSRTQLQNLQCMSHSFREEIVKSSLCVNCGNLVNEERAFQPSSDKFRIIAAPHPTLTWFVVQCQIHPAYGTHRNADTRYRL